MAGLSSLGSQEKCGRRPGGYPPGDGRDNVSEQQGTDCHQHKRQERDAGFWHSVDLANEEVPQTTPEDNAEGYANHDTNCDGNARLPRHADSQLAPGEPESLEQCHVSSTASDRSDERQPKCGHRSTSESDPEIHRSRSHRAIVDDLCRKLDRHHGNAVIGRERQGVGGLVSPCLKAEGSSPFRARTKMTFGPGGTLPKLFQTDSGISR